MHIDDLIENVNNHIDELEKKFGILEYRTDSIAAWILIIECKIYKIKTNWNKYYKNRDYNPYNITKKIEKDFFDLIAAGVCCLEQYNDIYPEGCPWEYMYDYDDLMKIEEFILFVENAFSQAKNEFIRDNKYNTLSYIKEMVIYSISCLLQNMK